MSTLLIEHGTVITMDPARRVLESACVLVRDGLVAAVGTPEELTPLAPDATRIDARHMAVLPGLIDSHGHAGHALVKSLGGGDGSAWVAACLQIYAHGSSADFWRAEARLAALDRLKSGITTSVSLFGGGTDLIRNDTPAYAEAYARALGECGTRGYLALGPNRPPYPHRFTELESGRERALGLDAQMESTRDAALAIADLHDGRVRPCLTAPVFAADRAGDGLEPSTVRDILARVMRLREELGLLYTQDGHRNGSIALAAEMDALGPWSLMSHSVDLTDADIAAAVAADAVIVHNPSAIMSIYGRCPAPELLDAGVRVVLGSDAAAPDRGYDMFRHMAQCMHYHRRHYRNARVMPAGKVLEMATIDAADGLGRGAELGSIEPGKRADLILVDLMKPHLVPINMVPMRLAHFANAADVDTVIVDGRVVMQGRRALMVDEAAILEDAQVQMQRVIRDNALENTLRLPGDFWGHSGLAHVAEQAGD